VGHVELLSEGREYTGPNRAQQCDRHSDQLAFSCE
jgi:hypothetical protein